MKKTIVVAMGSNYIIGNNNDLPWRGKLPADLKRFKHLTTGHTVIMGRKTWESIPLKFRPLPNRANIVVTRQADYRANGARSCGSLQDAFALCRPDHTAFIIGGAEIYQGALSFADEIQLTVIHEVFDGDARFPQIDWNAWRVTDQENHEPDEQNRYRYSFVRLVRDTRRRL